MSQVTDLDRPLAPSLRPTRLAFSSRQPSEPTTLSTLPTLLSSRDLVPQAIYASKLSAKLLPLRNPPRPSAHQAVKARAQARREADRIRRLTVGLVPRKRSSVWAARPDELKHAQLRGLADLWQAYVLDLLGLTTPTTVLRLTTSDNLVDGNLEGLLGKLAKAEFVGADVVVKHAPNRDLVGLRGIVVHETANTFKLVTPADRVKVVPKDHTVLTLSLPLPFLPPSYTPPAPSSINTSHTSRPPPPSSTPTPTTTTTTTTSTPAGPDLAPPAPPAQPPAARLQLDLFASQFRFRSADRAGRKFKTHGRTEMAGSGGMKL